MLAVKVGLYCLKYVTYLKPEVFCRFQGVQKQSIYLKQINENVYLPIQKQQPEVIYKKGTLENFAKFIEKHLCQSLFFNKSQARGLCNFIKKAALAQVFSCEFCSSSSKPQNINEHKQQKTLTTFQHKSFPLIVLLAF